MLGTLKRRLRGEPPRPWTYRDFGSLVPLGAYSAVGSLMGRLIGGALFNKAKGGDTSAMIFWMKTQAGWKDTTAVTIANPEGETFKTEDTGAGAAKLLALIENIAERRGTAG